VNNYVKFIVASDNAFTMTPLVNHTSGFNFTNASGTSLLNIDTTNQRVGIGTSAPSQRLHVAGHLLVDSSSATIGGTSILSSTRLWIQPDSSYSVGLRISGTTRTIGGNSNVEVFNQIDNSIISSSSSSFTVEEAGTLNIAAPSAGSNITINRAANLLFWNSSDAMILVARSAAGAGKNLIIQAGGAKGSGSFNGGELRLSSGISTNSGSSFISFYTATPGGSENMPTEKMRLDGNGRIGLNVTTPTALLDLNGATGYNQLRLRTSYTPTGSTDTNGNIGDIVWDDNYVYVKTSVGWKRAALAAF